MILFPSQVEEMLADNFLKVFAYMRKICTAYCAPTAGNKIAQIVLPS